MPVSLPAGALAAALAALPRAPRLLLVGDPARAEAVAAALAALDPGRPAAALPAPDSPPEEPAALSWAVAGQRAAAMAALAEGTVVAARDALQRPFPKHVAPLALAVGDAVPDDLGERLDALGYAADDRVDEPGEYALRSLLDLFPAAAERPVRVSVEDGRITAIRAYDPLSQRTEGDVERVVLHAAAETPGAPAAEALAGVALLAEPGTRPPEGLAFAALDIEAEAIAAFVRGRDPARALFAAVREARAAGDRVVIAGGPRDLRFLSGRLLRGVREAPVPVGRWAEVLAAEPGALLALTAELDAGWRSPGLLVIAAADVLGSRAGGEGGAGFDPFAEATVALAVGDAVIHEDHGVAILRGLDHVRVGGSERPAIRLEHAGGATRLVDVAEAARLWRYGGDPDAVALDRLDGASWAKRRAEVDAALAATARALLDRAAARAAVRAPACDPDPALYERFVAGFPFTDTRDQARAAAAIRDDLAREAPMDRLVVGDVGYGKTELALRAAALAALAGHQVAVVAPTTVLVRQHLETFARRFEALGIAVAGLSRLSSPAEARRVKAGLADGSVRVVVGTQAVAATGVAFADLALVVIDEEQRFGQAVKTRLRDLCAGEARACHLLMLTATPIPRTLQSALAGLQSVSLLQSPPARRRPIRTLVATASDTAVATALAREKARGGQSFVVVPRIEDLDAAAGLIARAAPRLRIERVHGKMPAGDVDAAMVAFASGAGDVLLATNIIESGLDVPRANTMIVLGADRFGLSQLHQLRGRVGRGGRRGHILLLTPEGAEIAPRTLKRLRQLEAHDRLGAGFALSAADLDARGAGDIAGEAQKGHVALIGVGLYRRLLEGALAAARGEAPAPAPGEIDLGEAAGDIPADWVPEEDVRLTLFARLARAETEAAVDDLADELEDRFGSLPEPALRLLEQARMRLLARDAGVAKVEAGPAAIALTPRAGVALEADGLSDRNGRSIAAVATEPGLARAAAVRAVLDGLGGPVGA